MEIPEERIHELEASSKKMIQSEQHKAQKIEKANQRVSETCDTIKNI